MVQHGGARSGPPNALIMGYNDGANGGAVDVFNRAALIMQIESEEGAKNVDAIAAIDGGGF